jgi:hypothetical protein
LSDDLQTFEPMCAARAIRASEIARSWQRSLPQSLDHMNTQIAASASRAHFPSRQRARLLRIFLWIGIIGWGVGLGAKLFDLLVVAAAWGAAPPQSLSLMPYGKLYPVNPGDFFQPLSVLLVVGAVGALVAGWRSPKVYRIGLFVPVIMLVVIWMLTPTIFWPMINDLWGVHKGTLSLSDAQVTALVHEWFVWDWLRTALIAAGFASSVQSLATASR